MSHTQKRKRHLDRPITQYCRLINLHLVRIPMRLSPLKHGVEILASMLVTPSGCLPGRTIKRMHPFQRGITSAHQALSEIVPAMNKVLRRNVVKVSSAGVPIRRVGDVLPRDKFAYIRPAIQNERKRDIPDSAFGGIPPRKHAARALGGEAPACWGAAYHSSRR